ncbi:MAG: flavodoxin family protein [Anaerolineae bacterium]
MRSLVVYYSLFGNTQRIAEVIAERLEEEGHVRVVGADQLTTSDLDGVDLVVLGSPTHRMNVPETVRPVLERLPKGALQGASVAAFDTSYKMSALLSRFTAVPKLARRLRKLGGTPLVPPETFHVLGREGPPYDGEIERARAWADSILAGLGSTRGR